MNLRLSFERGEQSVTIVTWTAYAVLLINALRADGWNLSELAIDSAVSK